MITFGLGFLCGIAVVVMGAFVGEFLRALETNYSLPEPAYKAIGRLARQQERPLRGRVTPTGKDRP